MINSVFKAVMAMSIPQDKRTQLYMLPIDMAGNASEVPFQWQYFIRQMLQMSPIKQGTGFLMIDSKFIRQGELHRRGRAHIDGNYYGKGAFGDDSKPGFRLNSDDGGMLIISDYEACKAWQGVVQGEHGKGGDVEHLRHAFEKLPSTTMKAGVLYHTNESCIHETMPVLKDVYRTLIRLTLPAS